MSKQYLLIHNFPALYEILNELKNSLSFGIRIIVDIDEIKNNINLTDLIISNQNLNLINQIKIDKFPIEYGKLIDILNIAFLKKKIEFKKNIKIGKFVINYNSRKLYKDDNFINLTEKETTIINFLNDSAKPVTIYDLQKKVWGYKSELETHTVETHVYRLRKKIFDNFKEKNFIKSYKNGYLIVSS